MPLHECMRKHTHREYLLWQTWLDEQWNIPSRSDNYQIQIAAEVRRLLNLVQVLGSKKQPRAVSEKDFQITYKLERKRTEEEKEKLALTKMKNSKAMWLAAIGHKRGSRK